MATTTAGTSRASSGDPVNAATNGWLNLAVQRGCGNLVEQIAQGIETQIASRTLRPGAKMPSVRQLARELGVSTFTVVEAYERLIITGSLRSQPGTGYYVTRRDPGQAPCMPPGGQGLQIDDGLLSHDMFTLGREVIPAGCGWLPAAWYGESAILEALRHATKVPVERLTGYGHPKGFPLLRQFLSRHLTDRLFRVEAEQIVLTHGASHALDLIARTLLSPGDTVVVESPGYGNLHELLKLHGCRMVVLPRHGDELDVDRLERELGTTRPAAIFVQTVLHNPLGSSLKPAHAHRLLTLADRLGCWVVEDDCGRELGGEHDASLAALDGLRRVICVSGFSKTLAPSIRVGYIAAPAELVDRLTRTKMLCGLTSAEINERAVYEALAHGVHRRHVERLRTRLEAARGRLLSMFEDAGITPLAEPRGGMFVSAGWPALDNRDGLAKRLAQRALERQLVLAPGDLFCLTPPDHVWFRFNVAFSTEERLMSFLRELPQLATTGKGR